MKQFVYDEAKFTELLVYAAHRLQDDPAGGAVKLNKVLFFAEFAHMRAHGRPISGVEYQKLAYGPAPRRLVPVRKKLVETGQAELATEPNAVWTQERLVLKRPPDMTVLSEDERRCVDEAVETLRGRSATETSSLSHEDGGWRMVEDGETIPFEAAYLRRPIVTEAIRRRASELADQLDQ